MWVHLPMPDKTVPESSDYMYKEAFYIRWLYLVERTKRLRTSHLTVYKITGRLLMLGAITTSFQVKVIENAYRRCIKPKVQNYYVAVFKKKAHTIFHRPFFGCNHTMKVAAERQHGPTLAIMKFKTEEKPPINQRLALWTKCIGMDKDIERGKRNWTCAKMVMFA